MKIVLQIKRRASAQEEPWWQEIVYETEDNRATVASALREINGRADCVDTQGRPVGTIRWESSCLQKKCGACAMVIGGKPRLACDAFLREFAKRGRVSVEPLRKFPVVADLEVDRSVLMDHLKELSLWYEQEAQGSERQQGTAYEASRCLQCGCCLEVCPEFTADGDFYGAAAFVPATRILTTSRGRQPLEDSYKKHVYAGCGKSLACRDICPAGIDTDAMLSRSNAVAVWKRGRRP